MWMHPGFTLQNTSTPCSPLPPPDTHTHMPLLPSCPPARLPTAADTKVSVTYVSATTQSTTTGTAGKAVTVAAVEVGTRVVVQKAASDPTSKQRISQVRNRVLPKVGALAKSALAKFGKGQNTGPRNVRTGTKVIRVKQ